MKEGLSTIIINQEISYRRLCEGDLGVEIVPDLSLELYIRRTVHETNTLLAVIRGFKYMDKEMYG